MEKGTTDEGMKAASLEAGKDEKLDSPLALQKEQPLTLSQRDPPGPSALQNWKVLGLCGFRPLSLWYNSKSQLMFLEHLCSHL